MKLECVITLANKKVEIPFRAFERSLRAVGCQLPVLVIPYDDTRFELPQNSQWLEDAEAQKLYAWLAEFKTHPTFRKYICLLKKNFLFADTDVVFLKNPETALASYEGFVINCSHWMSVAHTLTPQSEKFFEEKTPLYQKYVFNTGQFACDRALYSFESLQAACQKFADSCLHFPYHEQPAVNLLVHFSGVPLTSLTLPPHNIESSWAGHYLNRKPEWNDESKKPFMLHWAGRKFSGKYPVDELFLSYLTPAERDTLLRAQAPAKKDGVQRLKAFLRGVRTAFVESFCTHE